MTTWSCGNCHGNVEADQAPAKCPACGAEGEFVAAGDDGAAGEPKTLKEVRDRARKMLRGICGVYPACDGDPGRICQREAYGRPIGFGGVGSGSSFAANYQALARRKLKTRVVGGHFEPDIRCEFLGRQLSMPVLSSSVAGPARYNNAIEEIDFCRWTVQGCLQAGTLALRGDSFFYGDDEHPSLDSIAEADGRGIPIFKPRAQDVLLRNIERAERMGCPAVGVDLDGCGTTYLLSSGTVLFRKSAEDVRELTASTSLPFVCKGIMCVEDAEACVEAGASVIAVSNHGGRVLDGTPGVADVLPAIAERVGERATVTADGGVRTGFDVLKMLALGADAVLVGRDVARASFGGGAAGVRLQMERYAGVLRHAMLLTGCPDLASIGPHVFDDTPVTV